MTHAALRGRLFAEPVDRALLKAVRACAESLASDLVERDRAGRFSDAGWHVLGALGLPGLLIPQADGGLGRTALDAVQILEALARGCPDNGLLMALQAHIWGCTAPVLRFATAAQRERWLPGLADGSLRCSLAMTEAATGSAAFSLQSTARSTDEGVWLDGEKVWITNGVGDGPVLVFVREADGPPLSSLGCFWVDGSTPGLRREAGAPRLGLRTAPIGTLSLHDVHVPGSNRLGPVGSGARVFLHAMEWERAGIMSTALGSMERLLARVVRHARRRRIGDGPIGQHDAVAHRVAELRRGLETSRLLLHHTAGLLDQGKPAALQASLSKLHASEAHVEAALSALRILGAQGLLESEGVERELRDALCGLIYSGTSDLQRSMIARLSGV